MSVELFFGVVLFFKKKKYVLRLQTTCAELC